MMPMMMMPMYFEWGTETTVLFKGWKTTTAGQYWATLLAILVAAIVYEVVAHYAARLSALKVHHRQVSEPLMHECVNLLGTRRETAPAPGRATPCHPADAPAATRHKGDGCEVRPLSTRALIAFLHMIRVGYGLLLMLVAMTYNAGLFFALLSGHFLGNMLVNARPSKENPTPCH